MTVKNNTQWLVRKRGPQGYQITGPFPTNQIQSMMKNGSLDPDHELCLENQYWFSLYDKKEVENFFNGSGLGEKPEITKENLSKHATRQKRSFFRLEKHDLFRVLVLVSASTAIIAFLRILKHLKP